VISPDNLAQESKSMEYSEVQQGCVQGWAAGGSVLVQVEEGGGQAGSISLKIGKKVNQKKDDSDKKKRTAELC
jgi:hypothetical protein